MMHSRSTSLLFTLLAVPVACTGDGGSGDGGSTSSSTDGASTSSGEAGSTGGSPSTTSSTGQDTDGGSTSEASTSESADSSGSGSSSETPGCDAYSAAYADCFPDAPVYDDDCEYVAELASGAPACLDALDDYYACMSAVECRTLETYEGFPCRDEFSATDRACQGTPIEQTCQLVSGGGLLDGSECNFELDNCLDDGSYSVECSVAATPGMVDCTCTIEGQPAVEVTVEADEADCTTGLQEVLTTECGWPAEIADEWG